MLWCSSEPARTASCLAEHPPPLRQRAGKRSLTRHKIEIRSPSPLVGHLAGDNMRKEHLCGNRRVMRMLQGPVGRVGRAGGRDRHQGRRAAGLEGCPCAAGGGRGAVRGRRSGPGVAARLSRATGSTLDGTAASESKTSCPAAARRSACRCRVGKSIEGRGVGRLCWVLPRCPACAATESGTERALSSAATNSEAR